MPEPESNTRAITPPRASQQNATRSEATTPERVRQVELNRLRGTQRLSLIPCSFVSLIDAQYIYRARQRRFLRIAKARRREEEERQASSSSSSSLRNPNNKRPLAVVPASSNSPTRPTNNNGGESGKLRRDSRLGKYFDYDLSKMVNSKGGFLVEDDGGADDDLKTKERVRERERAMQSLEPRTCSFHFTPTFCGPTDASPRYDSYLPRRESQPQMS
jgi:hypothetical protein